MALLFGGANIALAEESGGFVGIGIGGGGTQHTMESQEGKASIDFDGINYGFVAGYKQFFNDYLGLRYYANLDIFHNLKKFESERPDITLINYGINVDFLGNFVSTEIADFGGFIGVGIGGNKLTGKHIQDIKDTGASQIKVSDKGFDVWLNVGLRTNIAKYHGIELVARVPFLPVKMIDMTATDDTGFSFKYKQTLGQKYSILARYSFSF